MSQDEFGLTALGPPALSECAGGMLAAGAGRQPADLDRAPSLQSRASTCQLSGFFTIGRADDRVAAQRQNGAGLTNGAAVVQDWIALVD